MTVDSFGNPHEPNLPRARGKSCGERSTFRGKT